MRVIIVITKRCFLKTNHTNNMNILHYDRIDVFEGIDIDKKSVSKECIICHYQYF